MIFLPGTPRIKVLPSNVSTGGSASVATTGIMTITTAPTGGTFALGQSLTMANFPGFTCILSLLSGTLGALSSTYQLSVAPPSAVGATAFTTDSQLHLPMPDGGYPTLEFVMKGQVKPLVDGSEVWRQLGWIPEITMRWSVYDDRTTEGWTVGAPTAANRPGLTDFLTILSGLPGSFSISPGPSAGGFIVQSWKVSPIGVLPGGYAKGLQVTFRGGTILSSQTLGAF